MRALNCTLGAFQPPHIGHEKIFKRMIDMGGEFVVGCVKQGKFSNRNVLCRTTQHNTISRCFINNGGRHPVRIYHPTNAWDFVSTVCAIVNNLGYYDEVRFFVGQDRIVSMSELLVRYDRDYKLPFEFRVIGVPRDDIDISSTKMRDLARTEMVDEFIKNLPECLSLNRSMAIYEEVVNALPERIKK